jgi:hypothetical protein
MIAPTRTGLLDEKEAFVIFYKLPAIPNPSPTLGASRERFTIYF